MKAQQLRLTNCTKQPNESKSIPKVQMIYLFETFSDLPSIARIDFIIVNACTHFKTNIKLNQTLNDINESYSLLLHVSFIESKFVKQ